MKRFFLLIPGMISGLAFSCAQVGINTDGSSPAPSAILDVKSSDRGFLPPRLSNEQITLISSPAEGLIVYSTTEKNLFVFNGTNWKTMDGIIKCGLPVIIHHVAGSLAPVNKTVTYGTVSDVAGENTKCWITRNLGASQQATAVNDATEASAGWYWQFNRKQGYKHDGSTLTPSWTIPAISENSDWITGNDPCALELGDGWRVPTYTEWYNVDNTGGWTNWNGPWNSPLKMHAAGYLFYTNGTLKFRGSEGGYWSSTQHDNGYSHNLFFYNTSCYIFHNNKAAGFSLRCIRG
jgi:hypothetical protein